MFDVCTTCVYSHVTVKVKVIAILLMLALRAPSRYIHSSVVLPKGIGRFPIRYVEHFVQFRSCNVEDDEECSANIVVNLRTINVTKMLPLIQFSLVSRDIASL